MRLAIDTNRYRDFCTGLPGAVERLARADEILVPFVTLAELRSGFLVGSRSRGNERVLTLFLNRPRVRVLFADEGTCYQYGRLFAQLRGQGTPIPTNDIWLAALVIQHDLCLYSRDGHFKHLPQVPILD
jgi:predicted nucleic acid-binding protein